MNAAGHVHPVEVVAQPLGFLARFMDTYPNEVRVGSGVEHLPGHEQEQVYALAPFGIAAAAYHNRIGWDTQLLPHRPPVYGC